MVDRITDDINESPLSFVFDELDTFFFFNFKRSIIFVFVFFNLLKY